MSLFHISENLTRQDAESGAGAVVLVASGELDYGASPQLRERILNHIAAGRRHLVLDLSAVRFIDSTAIGTLVCAATRLREVGGSVRVVCTEENERVLRIFEISGVASLIALHRSLREALSAVVDVAARPLEVRAWALATSASALTNDLRPAARRRSLEAVRTYAGEMPALLDGVSTGVISRTVDELA